MATITDIARETGMARTSVAQILQGRPGYNPQTRQRVRETARRLGYRPNYLSKALRGGKSMSIGMIWPMRGVTGDVDVGMAVLEQVRAKGYVTYQDEVRNTQAELLKALENLAGRRPDGLVLWHRGGWSDDLAEALRAFPAVVIVSHEDIPEFEQDLVVHDRLPPIRQVVDHFAATGRRRPALVMRDNPLQQWKIDCFMDRCHDHAMPMGPRSLIDVHPWSSLEPDVVEAHKQIYRKWLAGGMDVDAVLCSTDQGAMVMIRFLQDQGLRVPEDVAVVGWNNLSTGVLWQPALATIDRRRNELTEVVRELLLSRLESPGQPARRRTVEMEFVRRESAGGSGGQGGLTRRLDANQVLETQGTL